MSQMDLSPDEIRELDVLLKEISNRAKFNVTFDSLTKNWEQFIQHVEQGYDDSIYEYSNDLTTRNLLKEILDKSSVTLRAKLIRFIEPIDNRFNTATTQIERPVVPGGDPATTNWLYRIPRNPSDELANDLRSEGLFTR